MFFYFIEELKNKLQQPLPGEEAQFEMAHINRERFSQHLHDIDNYRASAVMVLLYPDDNNETVILLIERPVYDGHHSGQIAFPGGKAEPHETDLMETALREFFEETGSSHTPEVIGKLSPVYIPVSKFMVQPYVAYLSQRPEFNPSKEEVQQLIEWSVKELLNPNTVKETEVEASSGSRFSTPYFDVNNKVLWGATAMMLSELKWVLNK